MEAFYHAQRLDLVDVVIELLQRPSRPTLPTSSPSSLAQYGDYLRERYWYSGDVPTASTQWPPVPIEKPCNLAMIEMAANLEALDRLPQSLREPFRHC